MSLRYNKKVLFSLIAFIVIVVLGFTLLGRGGSKTKKGSQQSQVQSSNAKATVDINKDFEFKAVNVKKERKSVRLTLLSAERKDEIKVKGETRTLPKGEDYLLLRLEIDNTTSEKLAITPSDLIRLEDENGKLFAPDYHNGAIVLEPLSVKRDLVSFMTTAKDKQFSLRIGELDGEKEKIDISF